MIVDAHQHFWNPSVLNYPWLTPNLKLLNRSFLPGDLEKHLLNVGIQKTVVVQATSSLDETFWLLELAEKTEFIGAVVGWVDLTDSKVGEVLDRLLAYPKFKGVRHQVEDEPDKGWLIRPDVLRGLQEVSKRNLSYDLLVKTDQLHLMDKVLDACPNLRMVIDHAAKPDIRSGQIDDWAESLKKVSAHQDLMCKLSGLITEADHQRWSVEGLHPYVDRIVDCFGYERLMFGSDWPVCILAGTYREVWDSMNELLRPISNDDWNKVFGLNARKFYRIDA